MPRFLNPSSLQTFYSSLRDASYNREDRFKKQSRNILEHITDPDRLHIFHVLGFREELILLRLGLLRIKLKEDSSNFSATIVLESHASIQTGGTSPLPSVEAILKEIVGVNGPTGTPRSGIFAYRNVVLIVNGAGPTPNHHHSQDYDQWRKLQTNTVENVFMTIDHLTKHTRFNTCVWHDWLWIPLISHVLVHAIHKKGTKNNKISSIVLNGQVRATDDGFAAADSAQLHHIMSATRKLNIPITFLDVSTLQVGFQAFNQYHLPGLEDVWPALIPLKACGAGLKLTFDEICIYVFRLRAAIDNTHGASVAERAKNLFSNISTKKEWANMVFQSTAYSKHECLMKQAVSRLPWLVQLCKIPLYDDTFALQAFVTNPIGPTQDLLAVPIDVKFHSDGSRVTLRPDLSSNAHIILSKKKENLERTMIEYWSSFIKRLPASARRPKIAQGVALAWKDIHFVLMNELKEIRRDRMVARTWNDGARRQLDEVLKVLESGPFTNICKRSV